MPTRSSGYEPQPAVFSGFATEFFAFFEELSVNNKREWFEVNKPRYQAVVVDPMVSFIAAMASRLTGISPHFVADPRAHGGSMFRIYRDVRFSKDKRPYKDHAACQFRHAAGRDAHAPGFYVHLAPNEVIYGGGIWLPQGEPLARIRRAIAGDPEGWQSVIADKRLVASFGGIAGDGLKRPPKGYAADHRHIADLKRKSFFSMKHAGPKAAMSADFVDEVAETFRAATPLMKFLAGALDQSF